jgi:hypothetical protein
MRNLSRRDIPMSVALVLGGWIIGNLLGGLVAVLAVAAVYAGLAARRLPLVALGLLGCTAVSWLVGNASRWGTVSFDLVTENRWPGWFGVAAVVVLVVGVVLDRGDAEGREGPDGADERA